MKTSIPRSVEIILSCILLLLIFVAYAVTRGSEQPKKVSEHAVSSISFDHTILVGQKEVRVAYALTEAEQEQGLSGTPPLLSDQGMLFMFVAPATPLFWMKDMRYPLDMVWIGSDKKVIAINANVLPGSYPQTFSPSLPVQYVLEVPAGFAEKNLITVGTAVTL